MVITQGSDPVNKQTNKLSNHQTIRFTKIDGEIDLVKVLSKDMFSNHQTMRFTKIDVYTFFSLCLEQQVIAVEHGKLHSFPVAPIPKYVNVGNV